MMQRMRPCKHKGPFRVFRGGRHRSQRIPRGRGLLRGINLPEASAVAAAGRIRSGSCPAGVNARHAGMITARKRPGRHRGGIADNWPRRSCEGREEKTCLQ